MSKANLIPSYWAHLLNVVLTPETFYGCGILAVGSAVRMSVEGVLAPVESDQKERNLEEKRRNRNQYPARISKIPNK